jgi:hypothetical protein
MDLDETWIKDFEESDKNYETFYSEDVYYLKLHCIYIDKLSNIEKISKDKIFLKEPNCFSREELLGILKIHSFQNNIKYSVMTILKYNIDIEPLDLKYFLKSSAHETFPFLTSVKNIDSISFKKSISMFQDLNNIFIIFYEKDKTHMITRENMTKKIFLSNGHKKTLKKTT